jgi:SAM-dependent methyltransferase
VSDGLLAEQKRYYAARAPEYDDWWFRRGPYELDAGRQAHWDADVAEVEAGLDAFAPAGDVLELAAGTGLWTRRLVRTASRLVAVDASPETLEVNRARVDGDVEYVVADLFDWEPHERFDLVFFSFWLSHVPDERLPGFWRLVRSALRPGGRVFLIDNAGRFRAKERPASRHETRTLQDGRAFRIVKRYWEPAALATEAREHGFELELRDSAHGAFVYGGGS